MVDTTVVVDRLRERTPCVGPVPDECVKKEIPIAGASEGAQS